MLKRGLLRGGRIKRSLWHQVLRGLFRLLRRDGLPGKFKLIAFQLRLVGIEKELLSFSEFTRYCVIFLVKLRLRLEFCLVVVGATLAVLALEEVVFLELT